MPAWAPAQHCAHLNNGFFLAEVVVLLFAAFGLLVDYAKVQAPFLSLLATAQVGCPGPAEKRARLKSQ